MIFISREHWSYRSFFFISRFQNTSQGKRSFCDHSPHREPETETRNDLHKIIPPPKKNDHAAGEKSTNLWNNHLSSYAGGQGFHRNVTQRGCVQLCREKSGEILAVFRPVGNKTASWTLKVDDDFWEGGRGGSLETAPKSITVNAVSTALRSSGFSFSPLVLTCV